MSRQHASLGSFMWISRLWTATVKVLEVNDSLCKFLNQKLITMFTRIPDVSWLGEYQRTCMSVRSTKLKGMPLPQTVVMQWIKRPPCKDLYQFQQTICVFTTAGHLSLSKFNQFMSFFIRYILITPIYALVFQTILSFRYPTKLYVRSLHLCAVQSHNKGILQHTVTWLGHLLVRIGTQTGESLLDDSLMYWQATLASRQQAYVVVTQTKLPHHMQCNLMAGPNILHTKWRLYITFLTCKQACAHNNPEIFCTIL